MHETTQTSKTGPFPFCPEPNLSASVLRRRIVETVARGGQRDLAHYWCLLQEAKCCMGELAKQFRSDEDFAEQQAFSKSLAQLEDELLAKILEELSVERLLERLRGLPPEERLRGLSPEQRLAGLSEQEAVRMRELLDRKKLQLALRSD